MCARFGFWWSYLQSLAMALPANWSPVSPSGVVKFSSMFGRRVPEPLLSCILSSRVLRFFFLWKISLSIKRERERERIHYPLARICFSKLINQYTFYQTIYICELKANLFILNMKQSLSETSVHPNFIQISFPCSHSG